MRTLAILVGATALCLSACGGESAPGEEPVVSTGAAEDEVVAPELTDEEAGALAFRAAWEAAAGMVAQAGRATAAMPTPSPYRAWRRVMVTDEIVMAA